MDAVVGKTFFFDTLIPETERGRQMAKIKTIRGLVTERMSSADVIILADASKKDELEQQFRDRVRDVHWIKHKLELYGTGDFQPSTLLQARHASTSSTNIATPSPKATQKRKRDDPDSDMENHSVQPSRARFKNEQNFRSYTAEELEKLRKYMADHPSLPIDQPFWKRLREECPWARNHTAEAWRTGWYRQSEDYRRQPSSIGTRKKLKSVQHPKLPLGVTVVKAGPSKTSTVIQDSDEDIQSEDNEPPAEDVSNIAGRGNPVDQGEDNSDCWPAVTPGFKSAGPPFAPWVKIKLGCWRQRAVTLVKNSDPSQSSASAPTRPSTGLPPITAPPPSSALEETNRSQTPPLPLFYDTQPPKIDELEDAAVSQAPENNGDELNEGDSDYAPDNASFDAEDYIRETQSTSATQTYLPSSTLPPLSEDNLDKNTRQRPATTAVSALEHLGADHVDAYFAHALQQQEGGGLTQLFISQAPDQDFRATTRGLNGEPDNRTRLISATIAFIAHWLQRDVEKVWEQWQMMPLAKQNFAEIQKWCLMHDDTRLDVSSDETRTTTSTRRPFLAPLNAKKRYPYPSKPDREWAKHICRMLAALYNCRLPSKVYNIWVSTKGDARATEDILKAKSREHGVAPLDVREMGVGDIPRPWL